jgi:hypothetical protein
VQSTYYLNESRPQRKFAKDHNLVVVHLPSIKGSRQSINVQLPTAILHNLESYTRYIHTVRVQDNPLNKLVTTAWDELRDVHVVTALRARSFIDSASTRPLINFTHSNSVTRPMIGGAMACARTFLEQMAAIDLSSGAPPPSLEAIKAAVLLRFPELGVVYGVWWESEKSSLESAYEEATKAETLEMAKAHLKAAPFMLATHDRNLDKDCSTISELQYAPKTTDFVESSHVDWTTRTLCGASVEACLGVAHAPVLKIFVSDWAKRQAGAAAVRKKRQKAGGRPDGDQAAIEEQLSRHMTPPASSNSIGRSDWWSRPAAPIQKQVCDRATGELGEAQLGGVGTSEAQSGGARAPRDGSCVGVPKTQQSCRLCVCCLSRRAEG